MYLFPKRARLEEHNEEEGKCQQLSLSSVNITLDVHSHNFAAQEITDVEMTDTREIQLPYFGIQCDWDDSLKQKGGTSWISIRHFGETKSTHGDLICTSATPQWQISSNNEHFQIIKEKSATNCITVKDSTSGYECSFLSPFSAFNGIHDKSVVSLDVSEGGLGVSVCKDNKMKIWETETGSIRRVLDGHPADVYTCRFFPSGIVILSGGADVTLKIWSAETGNCPVTLKGHTAAINDTCVVDRGRNIISVGKDGSSRLWDVGEAKQLTMISKTEAPINSCCLLAPSALDLGPSKNINTEREIGTIGKLLLLAREDSKIEGVGVASRKEIFNRPLPSAGNRVIAIGINTFLVGCQDGQILSFDVKRLDSPKKIYSATSTPILDLMSHPRSPFNKPGGDESNRLFWASKSDGTTMLINPNNNTSDNLNRRMVILTGPDCDPVYQIKHDGNYIYTACRDGVIRKYSINHVTKILS